MRVFVLSVIIQFAYLMYYAQYEMSSVLTVHELGDTVAILTR